MFHVSPAIKLTCITLHTLNVQELRRLDVPLNRDSRFNLRAFKLLELNTQGVSQPIVCLADEMLDITCVTLIEDVYLFIKMSFKKRIGEDCPILRLSDSMYARIKLCFYSVFFFEYFNNIFILMALPQYTKLQGSTGRAI